MPAIVIAFTFSPRLTVSTTGVKFRAWVRIYNPCAPQYVRAHSTCDRRSPSSLKLTKHSAARLVPLRVKPVFQTIEDVIVKSSKTPRTSRRARQIRQPVVGLRLCLLSQPSTLVHAAQLIAASGRSRSITRFRLPASPISSACQSQATTSIAVATLALDPNHPRPCDGNLFSRNLAQAQR